MTYLGKEPIRKSHLFTLFIQQFWKIVSTLFRHKTDLEKREIRQANYTQIFSEEKITICSIVPVQIYSMEVNLPVIKFDERADIDNWTADKVYQELLN